MGKIAFLFPGQGAQEVGMAKELVENFAPAKEMFDRAADVLGYDLAKICFEGPKDKLDSTVHSQPALYVASLAALERLRVDQPDIVSHAEVAAGLSLGEYTALSFAGVFDFETGLKLVQTRGEAMQAAADETASGMVSILGLELPRIEELCEQAQREGEVLSVANHLCPGNIVVSGARASCEKIVELANAAGAMKVIPLAVAGAFHTPIMQSAVERLRTALADVEMRKPQLPVISNVDVEAHNDPEEIRDILVRQVVQPVRWEDSMRRMIADGVDRFYEIGPGRVLRGLLRRINRKLSCENIS